MEKFYFFPLSLISNIVAVSLRMVSHEHINTGYKWALIQKDYIESRKPRAKSIPVTLSCQKQNKMENRKS